MANQHDAARWLEELEDGEQGRWKDPTHIGTAALRAGVEGQLSRDPDVTLIAFVEIFLTESLPGIENFEGIFAVDHLGVWYCDADGSVEDPVWRQRLIPWTFIRGIVLHQAS